MILDTSALVAIFYNEPEREEFLRLLSETSLRHEYRQLPRTIHGR